jgi:hypothetical protein
MTTVNVSTAGKTTVVQDTTTNVVSVITAGPQGPKGDPGQSGIVVDSTAKVDGSVVYYDGGASQFKADSTWTVLTLTDGGNF